MIGLRRSGVPTGLMLAVALWGALVLSGTPASAQLRVVNYNALDAPTSTYQDGLLETIVGGIGTNSVNGIAKRLDIFTVQEQTTTTLPRIADVLNSYYGVSSYVSLINNDTETTDRVGIVYDSSTVTLVDQVSISGGGPRNPLRAQFRPVGYTSSAADLYVYSSHFKAGSVTSDITTRAVEGLLMCNNADALGADANVVFSGDFNFYNQNEQGYLNLLGGNGNTNAADPLNLAAWPSYSVAEYLTQSTRTASFGGGAGGGLDDRFDHQIISDDLLDGEGLSYIGPTSTGLGSLAHSYQAFGNDGVSYNTNINNTYTGRSQSAAVLDALYYFSDHLPVVADYQVPAWMDVTVDPAPVEVNLGESFALDVLIENIADVVGVNGADELDYTLSVSGDLIGGASGIDYALGGGQTYQVSLDTSSPGEKSGTITVTSSSQAVEDGSFSLPISFTVVGDDADFDNDGDVDGGDLANWRLGFSGIFPGFGDADFDGDTDVADLMIWQRQYTGPLESLAAVPEPGSVAIGLMGALLGLAVRRR